MAGKEIKYNILDHIATLGEPDKTGWVKEINVMCWANAKKPVIDIRKWNREGDEPKVGKGISLSLDEFAQLQSISIADLEIHFESNE